MPAQKRAPRLKESCDACSTAKVRCTKDKPNCSRCQQKGLSCSYSFSRRAGRRTTAAAVTKADRRPPSPSSRSTSPSPFCDSPSASSSFEEPSPQFGHAQLRHNLTPTTSDSDSSDVFDMWSAGPTYTTGGNPFSWDLQNSLLNQYTFPMDQTTTNSTMLPTPFDPMDMTMGPAAPTAPMMARNFSSATDMTDLTDMTLASDISSHTSSSVSSTMCEAVHDELSNLTTFAESMERKFDSVVRARLQYRDVYSEFGVPMDEIEGHPSSMSMQSPVDRILGSGGVQAGKGGVPSPDVNELAFYYSLAELKRRLKWVKEDVGNLMGGAQQQQQQHMAC